MQRAQVVRACHARVKSVRAPCIFSPCINPPPAHGSYPSLQPLAALTAAEMASMNNFSVDFEQVVLRFLKYALEGLVTAFAAYFIPGKKPDGFEILMIGAVAAATFAVLDLFAPAVGASVRTGAGFGIGANLVGFPGGNGPNVGAWR